MVGGWCGAVTRLGLVRHFLHHSAGPLPLQSRWFSGLSELAAAPVVHSNAPVEKLFPNGHPDCSDEGAYTRTGGAPSTANRHSGAPRACHAQGRDPRFREGTDPRAPIYCGRHAPRGRLTECSEVAAVFEHWGGESRGHQRRPGRLVQQRTVPPSRPLKRCTDVLCQFLSGGQGARARSDAWVLDSVFFVTASTVVG